ncbi:hypothetical protein GE21DRAFT_1292708 [Neurospora crassa]|nr:hypothetical protein GE21DRAFT_1292708 [Neurospora crassa]
MCKGNLSTAGTGSFFFLRKNLPVACGEYRQNQTVCTYPLTESEKYTYVACVYAAYGLSCISVGYAMQACHCD